MPAGHRIGEAGQGMATDRPTLPLRLPAMDLADQWPLLLAALAVFIIVTGILRRLAKLAFVGVALGAVALVLYPMVSDAI